MLHIFKRREPLPEPCMGIDEMATYFAYRRLEGWTEAKIEMVMHYLIYEQKAKERPLTRTEVLEIFRWQFSK